MTRHRFDAPWDRYEVAALRAWQNNGSLHPLTCPEHSSHALEVDAQAMRCEVRGCSYSQTWAPAICIGSPR